MTPLINSMDCRQNNLLFGSVVFQDGSGALNCTMREALNIYNQRGIILVFQLDANRPFDTMSVDLIVSVRFDSSTQMYYAYSLRGSTYYADNLDSYLSQN